MADHKMNVEEIACIKKRIAKIDWWHSLDLGEPFGVTPGREPNPRSRDAYMKIPWGDMAGKTVLDVGAWDGLYSFEAEKAGAKVTAAEPENIDGLLLAREVLASSVDVLHCSLEDGIPGVFDYVFCFGVLYHLTDPYGAIERLYGNTAPDGLLILETALTESDARKWHAPILEFCPDERDGDSSNWNYPNGAWVEAVLKTVGFVDIQCKGGAGNRGAWHARAPK